MAIIDKKILIQLYPWNKLSPSARELLHALATCTDVTGKGSPTWGGLMYFSGIVGKDTFKKARENLLNVGLITMTKTWGLIEKDGKKIPRATVTYQITDNILWKKSPSNQSKQTDSKRYQSMNSGSMDLRKEEDNLLDVNNYIGVITEQPTAVKNPIRKEINKVGGVYPTAIGDTQDGDSSIPVFTGEMLGLEGGFLATIDKTTGGLSAPELEKVVEEMFGKTGWKEHAIRIAEEFQIEVEGDSQWFDFFRKAYDKGQSAFLNKALINCDNTNEVKDIRKLFFHHFHKLVKESKE